MEPQLEQATKLVGCKASCARRLSRRLFECLRFGCGGIDFLLNCYGRAQKRLTPSFFLIKLADYSGMTEGRQVREIILFDQTPIKMLDVRVRGAP